MSARTLNGVLAAFVLVFAFGTSAFAMPTRQDLDGARPVISELMSPVLAEYTNNDQDKVQ